VGLGVGGGGQSLAVGMGAASCGVGSGLDQRSQLDSLCRFPTVALTLMSMVALTVAVVGSQQTQAVHRPLKLVCMSACPLLSPPAG
jgi:F0F1-type ATP synthase membrane subunit c/vacuolar-type H+-ATPase subunit K